MEYKKPQIILLVKTFAAVHSSTDKIVRIVAECAGPTWYCTSPAYEADE